MKLSLRILFSTFLASVLFFGSCLKDDNMVYPVGARLTVVNGFPSTTPVGYILDGRVLTSQLGIDYRSFTPILPNLFPGTRRLSARQFGFGADRTLSDTLFTFRDSSLYSSFLYGNSDSPRHLITTDAPLRTLGAESAFRFLHLASNVDEVNVYLNSTDNVIATDRSLENHRATNPGTLYDFVAKTSGRHKVIVTRKDGSTLIEREEEFVAGVQYSLILIGEAESERFPLYLGIVRQYQSRN